MKAVILAGGLGSRLKPFTDIIPKPLLPLGDKSILEIQIEQLLNYGVTDIYLAVNYKADYIESFLGDGSRFGIRLHYSTEQKPLGTCGPVKLLESELKEPFILMNGDILTKANFREIMSFSELEGEAPLNIVTKIVTTPFRFGNIESDGKFVTKVEEKPDLSFEILAGIYVLKPQIFKHIPSDTYYGIDTLIQDLLSKGIPITKYLLREYWLDVGVVEDYEQARNIYDEHFGPSTT